MSLDSVMQQRHGELALSHHHTVRILLYCTHLLLELLQGRLLDHAGVCWNTGHTDPKCELVISETFRAGHDTSLAFSAKASQGFSSCAGAADIHDHFNVKYPHMRVIDYRDCSSICVHFICERCTALSFSIALLIDKDAHHEEHQTRHLQNTRLHSSIQRMYNLWRSVYWNTQLLKLISLFMFFKEYSSKHDFLFFQWARQH